MSSTCYSWVFCVDVLTDMESPQIACVEGKAITVWEIPDFTNSTYDVKKIICNLQLRTRSAIGQKNIMCEAVDDSEVSTVCDFQVQITGAYHVEFVLILIYWLTIYGNILYHLTRLFPSFLMALRQQNVLVLIDYYHENNILSVFLHIIVLHVVIIYECIV